MTVEVGRGSAAAVAHLDLFQREPELTFPRRRVASRDLSWASAARPQRECPGGSLPLRLTKIGGGMSGRFIAIVGSILRGFW